MTTPMTSLLDLSDIIQDQQTLYTQRAQLEALIDATDALESMVRHIDTHGVVSEAHRASLMISLENLVGEPGEYSQPLYDALQSDSEGGVSTESFRDKLTDLWKRFVAMIARIVSSISAFWKKVATYRGQLELTARHLAKKGAMARTASAKSSSVSLGIEIKSFVVGESLLRDPDAIIRHLSSSIIQYRVFTDTYPKAMADLGRSVASTLRENLTGQEMLAKLVDVHENTPLSAIAAKLKTRVYRDPRFGNRVTMAAPPVLGGWNLYFFLPSADPKQTLIQRAAGLRSIGVKFSLTNVNVSRAVSGEIARASGMQIEALALKVIELLTVVETQEKAINLNRIDRVIKEVLSAGNNYMARVGNGDSYDESVLRFARNYASLAVGPVDQIAANLLTVARNVITYGNKSLN